jgi:hypothetical protein
MLVVMPRSGLGRERLALEDRVRERQFRGSEGFRVGIVNAVSGGFAVDHISVFETKREDGDDRALELASRIRQFVHPAIVIAVAVLDSNKHDRTPLYQHLIRYVKSRMGRSEPGRTCGSTP